MPSPRYRATRPPPASTIFVASRRYVARTSLKSSGSRRSARDTEPTRSQNITLSCLRSAAEPDGADGGDGPIAAADDSAPDVRMAPQSAQNLADAALLSPQAWHASDCGEPHWLQNLLPSGRSVLQVGHSITHPAEQTFKALSKSGVRVQRPPLTLSPVSRSGKSVAISAPG